MNHQLTLENIIRGLVIGPDGKKPTLLLHACCAPCSSYVLEYLSGYFDITLYYYNPNIMPYDEYALRLGEFDKLMAAFPARFEAGEYENEAYRAAVLGLEGEREGGGRCSVCFGLRLRKTAEKAKREGFDWFGTTLTVGPNKKADVINGIGASLGGEYGVNWLYSDFKKRGGYQRSIELCKKYGIYRQNYCGCRFSPAN
jgi:predicted adenine nucleotide alpha hydrolase (AANH) superfamily ATPase